MDTEALIDAAGREAELQKLDPALVKAICEQESAWKPGASRYEPAFEKRYLKKLNLSPADAKLRATSFGLMQILGQVARELGYSGPLEGLYKPSISLRYGCLKLVAALKKSKGDVSAALLAYNGGARPEYSKEVLARVGKYSQ